MTAIFRLVVVVMVAVAAVASVWAGNCTGNYWGIVIVLVAATAFWLLEVRSTRGTALYATQYLLVRSLSAVIVVLLGAAFVYFGVSELSSPVMFRRILLNVAANVIREFAGSIGLATLLCAIGVAVIVRGFRLLPGRKEGSTRG